MKILCLSISNNNSESYQNHFQNNNTVFSTPKTTIQYYQLPKIPFQNNNTVLPISKNHFQNKNALLPTSKNHHKQTPNHCRQYFLSIKTITVLPAHSDSHHKLRPLDFTRQKLSDLV
jgi:hypothetical protein